MAAPLHDASTTPSESLVPQQSRPTNVRWVIFGLASCASLLTYLHRYAWSTVLPFIKEDYGLTDTQIGALNSAFYYSYGFGQFPGGLLGDLCGPRIVIPVAAVLWSLAMVSPVFAGKYWGIFAGRLAFGGTQAPCYPNLGKITKSWFPLRIRTSLQGVVASFAGRAGGALAPFLIGTILMAGLGLNWQQSLFALASLGVIFAIVFWIIFRNRPNEHSGCNESEQQLIESDAVVQQREKPRINWSFPNIVNLGIFMTASFCSTFADNFFVFYMPQFLMETKGFSVGRMGIYAGLPIWGGAIGGLCGGILNDQLIRRVGSRWARRLVASGGKIMAAMLIAGSLQFDDGRLVMIVLACCKFFSDMSQPTWWGTVTDIGGPASGTVFGIVNTVGAIGAITAGYAMGWVLDVYSWNWLFGLVGGMYLLTALFWGLVNCQRRLVT